MGPLIWVSLACAFIGGAGTLWVEFKTYEERMRHWSEVWWTDGVHDEVEMYPERLFGDKHEEE